MKKALILDIFHIANDSKEQHKSLLNIGTLLKKKNKEDSLFIEFIWSWIKHPML
jgi:hypothetical protein